MEQWRETVTEREREGKEGGGEVSQYVHMKREREQQVKKETQQAKDEADKEEEGGREGAWLM